MKISDTKAASAASKKKKTSNAGAAEKAKFASLVESALDNSDKDQQTTTPSYTPASQQHVQSDVPEGATDRGAYMLDTLENLEKDILSGNPTDAIAKLKEALATQAINKDDLSPKMLELLDEIELRASIEVAKLED